MGDHTNVDYSLLGDDHVRAYVESDGAVGYEWNSVPTLLLTTIGRTSGNPRTVPLIFARDGDDYLVVASKGGMPEHPLWYRNLEANPGATIQVRGEILEVTARTARPEDKSRLWQVVNNVWPRYDLYQSYTDRPIPVVVLTPAGQRFLPVTPTFSADLQNAHTRSAISSSGSCDGDIAES